MAITFTKKKKKQQVLVFVLIGVLAISAAVLYFGVLKESPETKAPPLIVLPKSSDIEIDFSIFESTAFQDLQEPAEIPTLEEGLGEDGEMGRENPFIPY